MKKLFLTSFEYEQSHADGSVVTVKDYRLVVVNGYEVEEAKRLDPTYNSELTGIPWETGVAHKKAREWFFKNHSDVLIKDIRVMDVIDEVEVSEQVLVNRSRESMGYEDVRGLLRDFWKQYPQHEPEDEKKTVLFDMDWYEHIDTLFNRAQGD